MDDNNRDVIAPHGQKRLVRRDAKGRFSQSRNAGTSPGGEAPSHHRHEARRDNDKRGDREEQ